MVAARTGVFGALLKEHRDHLMSLAHEVSFGTGERIFDEGGKDPVLNLALYAYVAGVIADRLRATRIRLLDLYAPYGAGPVP